MAEWTRTGGHWTLEAAPGHRVEDVDALIAGVTHETETRAREHISPADRDLLISELYATTVALANRFEPRSGIVFRPWLYQRLRFAAIDFLRSWNGRKGEKRATDDRYLDAALRDAGGDDLAAAADVRSHHANPVGGAAAAGAGDRPEDWADDLGRLYARGDRDTVRAERELGLDEAGGAEGGDRPAGARAARPADGGSVQVGGRAPWRDCGACGWRHYRDSSGGEPFPTVCNGCGRVLVTPPGTVGVGVPARRSGTSQRGEDAAAQSPAADRPARSGPQAAPDRGASADANTPTTKEAIHHAA